jgi:hypothetical protein
MIKRPLIIVAILLAVGLAIRLLFTPFQTYLRWDAIFYMIKSFEIAQGSLTPSITWGYGWPIFLAPFFMLFKSSSVLTNMAYLRLINVVVGTIVLIPLYLLARKVLQQRLALIALLLGVFSIQLVVSSFTGYSEALYTFLFLFCIYFILKSDTKPGLIFLATLMGVLMYYVRINGFIILPIILISYSILRHKQPKPNYEFLAYSAILFLLLSAPMLYQRSLYLGSPFNYGVNNQYLSNDVKELFCPGNVSTTSLTNYLTTHSILQSFDRFITDGLFKVLSSFAILSVAALLPFFIYGICTRWKNKSYQIMLLAISVFLLSSIPIWKMFGTPRYFYHLIPLVIIISVSGISRLVSHFKKIKTFIWSVIIAGYILFSIFVLVNNYYIHYEADRQELEEGVKFTAWMANNLEGKVAIISGNDLLMLAYNDTVDCRERMGNYYCSPTSKLKLTTFGCHSTLDEALSAFKAENISYLAIDDATLAYYPYLVPVMSRSDNITLVRSSYSNSSWEMAVFRIY